MDFPNNDSTYHGLRKVMETTPEYHAYQHDLDQLVTAPFDANNIRAFVTKYQDNWPASRVTRMLTANTETLRATYERLRIQRKSDYEHDGKLAHFIKLCEERGTPEQRK